MAEELELVAVDSAAVINAQSRAEIDMQIATAHMYPREMSRVLRGINELAKLDEETASSCFYVLRRQGQEIKGLSVRMAEIVASQWGNARFDKKVIANDGKTITAQCTAHDLETNVAIRTEVKRRITDKNGKTYSEDMQVTTGNAAMAIAFRNAVLQLIPRAIIKKIIDETDQIAHGKALSLEERRNNVVAFLARLGVTEEILFDHCGVTRKEEITEDMIVTLRGECTAIKEGTTSAEEEFIKPWREKQDRAKAQAQADGARDAAAKAAAEKRQKALDAASKGFGKTAAPTAGNNDGSLFNNQEEAQQ